MVEENADFSTAFNPSTMPYLVNLANNYSVATQWYAATHPSIGNYFELVTGNVITNDDSFTDTPLFVESIVREIVQKGLTWKVYAESLPSVGYTGGDTGAYLQHHNPFSYLADVLKTSQKNNMVPFSQFASDLSANSLPNLSFVVPNRNDDAHDGTLQQADAWLQNNIQPVFNNATFQVDGLLAVTFDESATDNTNGGGLVLTVIAGPDVQNGYTSTTVYTHAALLRLVCRNLGIAYLGESSTAADMSEFFKQ